jgi:CRP-like cAMP-binding protein
MVEISLERGQVLFEPGDPIQHVYLPSNAVLSILTVMRDGGAVESSTVGHETGTPLLWALASDVSRARVFTQIAGAAVRLPAARLRARAQESSDLMRLLVRHAGASAFQAEQGVACNILHSATARLGRWILMTQDRTGGRALPLTQEYMAVMTGVQRSTISMVANELRSAGAIRFSRGVVEVTDRAILERCACECYQVVRGEFDRLRLDVTDPRSPRAVTSA